MKTQHSNLSINEFIFKNDFKYMMENLGIHLYAVATFLTLCGFNSLFFELLPYYREYCFPGIS